MDWFCDPNAWLGLLTLTALEIVLGIDNVIFISILAGKLPGESGRRRASSACCWPCSTRIGLLFSISWLTRLTAPLFTLFGQEISGRDLVLIAGGLFLLAKSTYEIHDKLEGGDGHDVKRAAPSLTSVLVQIMLLDIVFSLDSVITAVGMVEQLSVMVIAVVVAVGFMLVFSGADQPLRQRAPHDQDPGPLVPDPDRRAAGGRGLRPAHPEGLRLLRHGVSRWAWRCSTCACASWRAARAAAQPLRGGDRPERAGAAMVRLTRDADRPGRAPPGQPRRTAPSACSWAWCATRTAAGRCATSNTRPTRTWRCR